jgi:pyruvate formate-lyase activating enzyme-like uncharacterized protein
MRLKGNDFLGYWFGDLPRGCKLCFAGLKSVLFITGLCNVKCFYCPISPTRKLRDLTFINDIEVRNVKDILTEVIASLSKGVGITGGEPLEVVDRVVELVKVLKDVFGGDFHIHLYTNGVKLNEVVMERLVNAGLDEIRIHVISDNSFNALRICLNYPVDVVIENPVIPNDVEGLKKIIEYADGLGVKYVNLNELEVSELNFDELILRGFKISGDGRSVIGSRETALEVLRWVMDSGIRTSVHFCPAIYKDRHQYLMRMSRRAIATKRVFEEVSNGIVKWLEVLGDEVANLYLQDLVTKVGDKYLTHTKLGRKFRKAKVVEALPLTPRKVLNEFPLGRE